MSKQAKIAAKKRGNTPNPKLDEILNRKKLDSHVNNKIVSVATHENHELPLYVYNYTSLCERRWKWDQVTVTCRGLVRDNKGFIVSRPIQKFFGWGGKSSSAVRSVSWDGDWFATEKVDGTMITAASYQDQLVLATRGSFDDWRLDEVRKLWPAGFLPEPGKTIVLEYIGPDNPIVVPYTESQLVALAVIDNWTGADDWIMYDEILTLGFRATERYSADSPEELLALLPPDVIHEGFVVVWDRKGKPSGRLKVKTEAWRAEHRRLFGHDNL